MMAQRSLAAQHEPCEQRKAQYCVPIFPCQALVSSDLAVRAVLLTDHFSISSTGLFRANTPRSLPSLTVFTCLSMPANLAPYITMRMRRRPARCPGSLHGRLLCRRARLVQTLRSGYGVLGHLQSSLVDTIPCHPMWYIGRRFIVKVHRIHSLPSARTRGHVTIPAKCTVQRDGVLAHPFPALA